MRPSVLFLLLFPLSGCGPRGSDDLTGRLLFTASGTFDAQADQRTRSGPGHRTVNWATRPPIPAKRVTVQYDSDQRAQSWMLTAQHPTFKVKDLEGSPGQPRTVNGQSATLFTTGRLKDVLLLNNDPNEWTFLTLAYAQHHLPQYLPAFKNAP